MTGEVIGDLLRPLIGKSGTIFMVVSSSESCQPGIVRDE